jgi:hypothetical protein
MSTSGKTAWTKNKWRKNARRRGHKGSHLVTASDIDGTAKAVITRRKIFLTLSKFSTTASNFNWWLISPKEVKTLKILAKPWISTIFFWFLFKFVKTFSFIDFIPFPFYFVWNMGNMEEIGTLHITSTPAKFDSDGCQDLSLQVAAGGRGTILNKYLFSLYICFLLLLLGD